MSLKLTLMAHLERLPKRSAWERGVNEYAFALVEDIESEYELEEIFKDPIPSRKALNELLLNGASSWKDYSWGGSGVAWIYDQDIAAQLCAPWELKRTDNGRKKPNRCEEWLDVQSRALAQASNKIYRALFRMAQERSNEQ